MLGYRQVGKAIDFDSIIRRFKSSYPIQFLPLAIIGQQRKFFENL
jgi:hypothetical protein